SPDPLEGTVKWALAQATYYDDKKLSGPDKDLSSILEPPHIEACAIMCAKDDKEGPAWFDRRKKNLEDNKKVNEKRIKELDEMKHARTREIKTELKAQARTPAKPAKAQKPSPAAATWPALQSSYQQPVNGEALYHELVNAILKFVHMSKEQASVLALWILLTWVFEKYAPGNPFIRVVSATENCG